ncbi:hypothetical protein RFI_33123, partial [Reticulomyxa filosa]
MFREDDQQDDDDESSIKTSPEEDYVAIQAYYDLDEKKWESKRSSHVAVDHGHVISRKMSYRLSQFSNGKKISDIFQVGTILPTKGQEETQLEDVSLMGNTPTHHQKKETYSAIRALFANEHNEQIHENDDGLPLNTPAYPTYTFPLTSSFDFLANRSSLAPTRHTNTI